MNPTLFNQLRDIEPDFARSYERVYRTAQDSIERPSELRELIDDVDTLVDQLLGKITELETDVYGAKKELCKLKTQKPTTNKY